MQECSQENRIVRIEQTINGNGSEGIKQKVVRMDEKIKSINTKMNFNTWLTGAMLVAIIGSLVKTWM
jgi:uncharacterized FlaG/YvyC family protein